MDTAKLIEEIDWWIAHRDKGQKYACVRPYNGSPFQPGCEGCLLTRARDELKRLVQPQEGKRADQG